VNHSAIDNSEGVIRNVVAELALRLEIGEKHFVGENEYDVVDLPFCSNVEDVYKFCTQLDGLGFRYMLMKLEKDIKTKTVSESTKVFKVPFCIKKLESHNKKKNIQDVSFQEENHFVEIAPTKPHRSICLNYIMKWSIQKEKYEMAAVCRDLLKLT